MGDFRVQLAWGIHGTGSYNPTTDRFTISSGHDGGGIVLNALVGFAFRDANNRIFRIRSNTATVVSGGSFQVEVYGIAPQPDPVDGSCIIDAPAAYYQVGGGVVSGAPPPTGYPTLYTVSPLPSGFQPTTLLTDVYSEDVKLGVRMQNALLTPVSAETPLTTFVAPAVAGSADISISTSINLFPACIGFAPSDWICVDCGDRTRNIIRWGLFSIVGTVDNTTHEVRISRKQITPFATGYSVLATVSPFGEFGNCSPLSLYGLGGADGLFQDHFAVCNYAPGTVQGATFQYKVEIIRISDMAIQGTDESSVIGYPAARICVI